MNNLSIRGRTNAEKYFSSLSLGSPADDAEALSHKTILLQLNATLTLADPGDTVEQDLQQGIVL